MATERGSAELWRDRMVQFMKIGTSGGVSNFFLEGVLDVPTVFENFVGIFPYNDPNLEGPLAVMGSGVGNTLDFYNRILNLELPERVKDLIKHFPEVISDEARGAIESLEDFFIMAGLPTRVLAFGKTRDTKEEAIVLYATVGIHPQQALDDIKDRIRHRLPKLN